MKHITETETMAIPGLPLWTGDPEVFGAVLDHLPLGVLVINEEGRVVYCNEAQAKIDDMDRGFIIGKLEMELYGPYLGPGIMKTCQQTGQPILGYMCHYRTVKGKIINGAYWVFPIKRGEETIGALCLTQMLKNTPAMVTAVQPYAPERLEESPAPRSGRRAPAIIGADPAFRKALSVAQTTASSPSPVLICGETGTGKEMFVRAIKEAGNRSDKPFQVINCAAIPATLLEGILFGAVKGSFTGAVDRPGLFEEANGGTIYLDEIDSMPMELQPKLLRVIQEMRVRRLGSSEERAVDVKIVSSIGCTTTEVLHHGRLRPDLFYRLAVISVIIPPLRMRMGDLDDLVGHFIAKYNQALGKNVVKADEEVMRFFRSCNWPGNVRELEYVIAGAINLTAWENTLHLHHIPEHHRLALEGRVARGADLHPAPDEAERPAEPELPRPPADFAPGDLQRREGLALREALEYSKGHLGRAAGFLGISRQLLSYKMKKHGLDRREFKALYNRTGIPRGVGG